MRIASKIADVLPSLQHDDCDNKTTPGRATMESWPSADRGFTCSLARALFICLCLYVYIDIHRVCVYGSCSFL